MWVLLREGSYHNVLSLGYYSLVFTLRYDVVAACCVLCRLGTIDVTGDQGRLRITYKCDDDIYTWMQMWDLVDGGEVGMHEADPCRAVRKVGRLVRVLGTSNAGTQKDVASSLSERSETAGLISFEGRLISFEGLIRPNFVPCATSRANCWPTRCRVVPGFMGIF